MPDPIPLRDAAAPAGARAPVRLVLDRQGALAGPAAAPVRLERKQAALLAYLHLAGPSPRARLAGLLWPDAPASGARANLRQCLARLRRLAPELLAEADESVALGLQVVVEASGEGQTDLLAGYDYADCDDFARWLQSRVEAGRSARQAGVLGALRAAVERGDLALAQAHADELLALDAESEEPYRALMEVAWRRGDLAAAVRAWDRCREMLRRLYGVAPSSATQALGAAILAAAPPSAGNLGAAPPALFGRGDEFDQVRVALRQHRLVTLLGTGGVGKTSLALAVAHAERERWPAGVWFVDMAPVTDAGHVPQAIAHALGVALPAHRPPLVELAATLAAREMLVVVDNAEHLQAALSAAAGALLAGTAHLRLLVTSRQALRLPQEQRFPLAGLAAPDQPDLSDPRGLGALALFEARVTALEPRFRLTPANAPAVAEVCRRLDGLPLAIELAAARVPVLGLDELRDRLHRSLRVLGARATISTPRHETLRATFDWTHALLSADEQKLLRRLAVFVGGFGLALAEDVMAFDAPDALLDTLGALIDKSLVVVRGDRPPRYRLLEVTRAYAIDRLVEAGEFEQLSTRHAQAVRRLFAEAEADLNEKTHDAISRGRFLERLSPELDNLRAARQWSRGSAQGALLSVELAATSTEALRLLGRATEALHSMLALREPVDDAMPPAVRELYWTGLCALGTHGRMPRAEMLVVAERAERLYRQVGSARRIHLGLYRKGFALLHLGDLESAGRAVAEMGTLEAAGWPARAVVQRLNLQGAVEAMRGRFEVSVSAFTDAAALLAFEPEEQDVVLNLLCNLCMSLIGAGRDDEALAVAADVMSRPSSPVVRNIALRARMAALTFTGRLDEAATLARQAMPDWLADDMLPHMLSVFAWLAHGQGRLADAVRLDAAARTQVARMGLSNAPVFARAGTQLADALAQVEAEGDLARWRLEGEHLDLERIVDLCLGSSGAGLPRAA